MALQLAAHSLRKRYGSNPAKSAHRGRWESGRVAGGGGGVQFVCHGAVPVLQPPGATASSARRSWRAAASRARRAFLRIVSR